MSWTEYKVDSFIKHYFTYKHYQGQYDDSRRESKVGKVWTHRAPFENAAIDIAEFDTAVKQLTPQEYGIFILYYLFDRPIEDVAGFICGGNGEVMEIAYRAKAKVKRYLMTT
uniref:Uncharacterized protein n=1 Tax=viral metagenome TaxID=1070528 RepID=A0A6M3Y285_9ZZZZ